MLTLKNSPTTGVTGMKRPILVMLAAGAMLLTMFSPATADVEFTQQVVLRKDHGPYNMRYSSFADGAKSCTDCPSQFRVAGGKLTTHLRTYKLKEQNNTYDYYLVDATVSTSRRSGNEDWGYLEATVRSTKRVNYATYSSGKSETKEDCGTWPINISGSFHGISVGTKVAEFSTCTESWISRRSVKLGQRYHVTNFNGVRKATFQRFVRVRRGVQPAFRVSITRPTDYCNVYTFPDGAHNYCYNTSKTKKYKIGTSR
jgi:hypothetical protein